MVSISSGALRAHFRHLSKSHWKGQPISMTLSTHLDKESTANFPLEAIKRLPLTKDLYLDIKDNQKKALMLKSKRSISFLKCPSTTRIFKLNHMETDLIQKYYHDHRTNSSTQTEICNSSFKFGDKWVKHLKHTGTFMAYQDHLSVSDVSLKYMWIPALSLRLIRKQGEQNWSRFSKERLNQSQKEERKHFSRINISHPEKVFELYRDLHSKSQRKIVTSDKISLQNFDTTNNSKISKDADKNKYLSQNVNNDSSDNNKLKIVSSSFHYSNLNPNCNVKSNLKCTSSTKTKIIRPSSVSIENANSASVFSIKLPVW